MTQMQDFIVSSGNVFSDIGVSNPEEALVRSQLAAFIHKYINEHHLTQTEAAKLLKLSQPKVSALINGKVYGFSIDKLLELITRLHTDVDIVISPAKRQTRLGEIHVRAPLQAKKL